MGAVTYRLAMPRPESHLFEVTLRARGLPAGPDGDVAFRLPAWTPGSYLVRDHARHVQDLEARDARGRALDWDRLDKHTWRVKASPGEADVTLAYRVYANDLTVRTSHLDATHAYADGTSVFLYPVDGLHLPATIEVAPPTGWVVDTALPRAGRRNAFRAEDYAEVADATFEIGTHRRLAFEVQGKRHRVALYGRGNEDAAALVRDLEAIVREEAAMMGGPLPYDEYLFVIHLADKAGGGLEHRASNTSLVDRFTFKPPKRYEDFLALEAHEFFHVWNVKRLKPAVFQPYDFTKEVYTTLLWAFEGLTSYYDHLVLARAGLVSEERYRDYLGEMVTKLREQPGRLKVSLEDASKLTWVKLYKPDENTVNSNISYYLKGELVGLVLDLAIRKRTGNKRSLDDVMRALYRKYPPGSGGVPESPKNGWKAVLEEVAGGSWTAFWKRYIAGSDEVDFERWLPLVGWRLKPEHAGSGKDAAKRGEYVGPGAWLGCAYRVDEGRLRVKHVLSGSPAERAGIAAGDEVVAVDGIRARDEEFVKSRLREREAGDRVEVAVFRRDALTRLEVRLGSPPPEKWKVEEIPRAPASAKAVRAAWLKPYATRTRRPSAGGERPRRRQAREAIADRGE